MKKLTAEQAKEKGRLAALLEEKVNRLNAAIQALNDRMDDLCDRVRNELTAFNDAVIEANEWRDNLKTEMQDYYDERPERWQESEGGVSYEGWIDEWTTEIEEISSVDLPEEVSELDPDIGWFADLPNTPDEVA